MTARIAAILLIAFGLAACQSSEQALAASGDMQPETSPASTPAEGAKFDVEWRAVEVSDLGVVQVAIARPSDPGPFPVVIVLHGTHGFAREYVQLAQDLAANGMLAVAACWFSGGGGSGAGFVAPISCPEDAPPMPAATSLEAWRTVDAVVKAARALPNARSDQVALFGHSRGGGAALNYSLKSGDVDVVILNSVGYPAEVTALAPQATAPILILHGTADSPVDGGSAMTDIAMARAFVAAMRDAGKPVEANYYEGGTHNSVFTSPTQYEDEVRRIVDYLRQNFR